MPVKNIPGIRVDKAHRSRVFTKLASVMNIRTHVYSPLQNTALWIAAWLYGYESYDHTEQALNDLEGPHRLRDGEIGFFELAQALRTITKPTRQAFSGEPLLRIVLDGPGTPVGLPAHHEATAHAQRAGGAIVISAGLSAEIHILVPQWKENRDFTVWESFIVSDPLPAASYLAPGDADLSLAQATRTAATLIQASGIGNAELASPRLTVGMLNDFYETPGLPDSIAPRAAKLIARADKVTAIMEAVIDTLGDHSFDQQLLSLSKHIREARMAAVSYAIYEWGRLAG